MFQSKETCHTKNQGGLEFNGERVIKANTKITEMLKLYDKDF